MIRPKLPAAAVAVLASAICAAPVAAAPAETSGVAAKRVAASPERVSGYWTPERMREAVPLAVEPPAAGVARPRNGPRGEPIVIPPAAPPRWQPRVTPTSQPRPRADDDRVGEIPYTVFELTDPASYPNVVHGAIFFTLGRTDYSCSGTVVNSATQSVVVTAGHCVHAGGRGGPWSRSLVFAPGYADEVAPFGVWVARQLFTTRGWRQRGRFAFDFGAVATSPNALGQTVEGAVGGRGIAFNQPREQAYRAYGYPVAPTPLFDGESLWACDSAFGYLDPFPERIGPPQSAIGCNMGAGSSGGGWVVADQYVNSVTSFGYAFLPQVLFGTYFGDAAAEVYARAGASAPIPR